MPMFASPDGIPCEGCGREQSPIWYKRKYCSKYSCKQKAGVKTSSKKRKQRDGADQENQGQSRVTAVQPEGYTGPLTLLQPKQVIGHQFKSPTSLSAVEARSRIPAASLRPEYLVRGMFKTEDRNDAGFPTTQWVSEAELLSFDADALVADFIFCTCQLAREAIWQANDGDPDAVESADDIATRVENEDALEAVLQATLHGQPFEVQN